MDCRPQGSSVDGILQARILEWVAISFSRGSSRPRNRTRVSRTAGLTRGLVGSPPPGDQEAGPGPGHRPSVPSRQSVSCGVEGLRLGELMRSQAAAHPAENDKRTALEAVPTITISWL